MNLRRIVPSDAHALFKLWNEVYSEGQFLTTEPPPEEAIASTIKRVVDNKIPNVVLSNMDCLLGSAEVFPGNFFEVSSTEFDPVGVLGIQVLKTIRGRGLGKQLMSAILEDSMRYGYHVIELGVLKSNNRAIGLYERFGFKVVSEYETAVLLDGNPHQGLKMILNL